MPTQNQEMSKLLDKFIDVFSTKPGLTYLMCHDIKTLPSAIICQSPY